MTTPSSPLRPAILIVSDTAKSDSSTDRSAPILSEVFSGESGRWTEPIVKIVGDEIEQIRETVKGWTDQDGGADGTVVNLVITTGGTGFSGRDWTPEVSLLGISYRTNNIASHDIIADIRTRQLNLCYRDMRRV